MLSIRTKLPTYMSITLCFCLYHSKKIQLFPSYYNFNTLKFISVIKEKVLLLLFFIITWRSSSVCRSLLPSSPIYRTLCNTIRQKTKSLPYSANLHQPMTSSYEMVNVPLSVRLVFVLRIIHQICKTKGSKYQ